MKKYTELSIPQETSIPFPKLCRNKILKFVPQKDYNTISLRQYKN